MNRGFLLTLLVIVIAYKSVCQDVDPPILVGTVPDDNSSDVGLVFSEIRFTFNENVVINPGTSVFVVKTEDNTVVEDIYIFGSTPSTNFGFRFGQTLLEPATQYHVIVNDDAIRDESNNSFPGISDTETWNFTTQGEEATPPSIVSLSPADNEVDVSITEDAFTVEFDELVRIVSGKEISIVKSLDNTIANHSLSFSNDYFNEHQTFNINGRVQLEPSTEYYIQLEQGIVQDVFGNEFDGLTDGETWSFTTRPMENQVPTVSDLTPNDGALNISNTINHFSIDFDEDVETFAGKRFVIHKRSNGEIAFEGVTFPTDRFFPGHNFNFGNILLEPLTEYYISLEAGMFADGFGNEFPGISDPDIWNFTTAAPDDLAPEVVPASFQPESGTTGVEITRYDYSLQFDEDVRKVEGIRLRIVRKSDDVVIAESSENDSDFFSDFHSYIFDNLVLEPSTEYYLTLEPGAVVDAFGNEFAGLNDPDAWFYTTEDPEDQSPVPISFDPMAGMIDVEPNQRFFGITFDEKVQVVANKKVRVFLKSSDEMVKEKYLSNNPQFQQSPHIFLGPFLEAQTEYYITVEQGAFIDSFGNESEAITDPDSWSFTTGVDVDPPVAFYFIPRNGETDVSQTEKYFNIHFTEDVKQVVGKSFIIKKSSDNSILTTHTTTNTDFFSASPSISIPDLVFESLTTYYITIEAGAFVDRFGNEFEGILENDVWSFTIGEGDLVSPSITSLNPEKDFDNFSIFDNVFSINFDEEVRQIAGKEISLHKKEDNTLVAGLTLADSELSGTQSLIFNDLALEISTEYYIKIDEGAFEDLVGNPFGGISDNSTWSFITESPEEVPPVFVDFFPVNGSGGVAIDGSRFTIFFDEYVRRSRETFINLVKKSNDAIVARTFITASEDFRERDDFFMRNIILEPNTTYYVQLEAGAYTDVFGNSSDGIDGPNQWEFTTEEVNEIKPAPRFFNPYNGAENVRLQPSLSITFDSPVKAVNGKKLRFINSTTGEEEVSLILEDIFLRFDQHQSIFWLNGPLEYLKPSTNYYIEIDEGGFEDAFGNRSEAISDPLTWSFTTQEVDDSDPIIVSFASESFASDAPLFNESITVRMSKEVRTIGCKSIQLVKSEGDEVVASLYTADSDFFSIFRSFSLNNLHLEPETQYYIQIEPGAFVDHLGNEFSGIGEDNQLVFTTTPVPLSGPPQIVHTFPSSDYPISQFEMFFTVVFDRIVKKIKNKRVDLIKTETGALVATLEREELKAPNRSQYFRLEDLALEPSTQYHLIAEKGAFIDNLGNESEEISDPATWSFQTKGASNRSPRITALSVQNESQNVAIANNFFSITFNKGLYQVGGKKIELRKFDDDVLVTDITTEESAVPKMEWYLNFTPFVLEPSTKYYLNIEAGTFKDASENSFEGIQDKKTWVFTTDVSETEPPLHLRLFPNNTNGIGVVSTAYDFSIFFSEFVTPVSGKSITIHSEENDEIVRTISLEAENTFNRSYLFGVALDFALEPLKSFYILIDQGSFVDALGNEYGGITDKTIWTFTTECPRVDIPQILALDPMNGEMNVNITNTNFDILFSRPVKQVANKSVALIRNEDGVTVMEEALSESSFVNGVSLFEGFDLQKATSYYITIEQGAFVDGFGNELEGFSMDDTWGFTTVGDNTTPGDKIAPTLLSVTPTNQSTEVSISTQLGMVFDESITSGDGNIFLFKMPDELIETISATSVTITGEIVTIGLSGDLASNSSYYINVDESAFMDLSENPYAGIGDKTTWTFTTEEILTTGIHPADERVTIVYPIPSDNMLKIVLSNNELVDNITLEIIDILGNKQYLKTPHSDYGNIELDISNLPSGTYFLRMFNGHKQETHRFIKR